MSRLATSILWSCLWGMNASQDAQRCVAVTFPQVIIHHANRLHIGIADRRADERKATLLECTTHGIGFGGCGGELRQGLELILNGLTLNEGPDIAIEGTELVLDIQESPRIFHRGMQFEPVADKAGIAHELFNARRGIARDALGVEAVQGLAEIFCAY